jgi:putative hydrolase of the HAD superfamily
VIWDFDGTLGYRDGMWRGCLMETLDAHRPGHGVNVEIVREFLRDGFPWHRPEVPHRELSSPEAWWRPIQALIARAYIGAGISPADAEELAALARARFADPTVGWHLFPDTVAVLGELRGHGWRHAILSNHIPELSELVDGLGLSELVDTVLSSASTGYEKPHPTAFALALEACGHPSQVWMVGDNPIADVAGAQAAGIPAIRVRTSDRGKPAADLSAAARIITASDGP